MLDIQDSCLYYTYDKHQPQGFEPKIGDKLWDATEPYNKDKCLELEKMLSDAGFNTRVAQGEDKSWSVAIIK